MYPGGRELVFACPYCGETNEFFADAQEYGQVIVVDCHVCCQPIEIGLPADPDQPPEVKTQDG
ncbi:MAG TPA: CPXCG motif-containing cysteine-rich protein [Wenzhouxiangella sp.]|nr:CPXCG motif-containing cysteine-rich protein [Wenzhouxiangella sp.]